jgi:hypothetical protein
MVSLEGIPIVNKLPGVNTKTGMVLYGLAGLQAAGMLTGMWNLIPKFTKTEINYAGHTNSVKTDSPFARYAYAAKVQEGAGGIRFGNAKLARDINDGNYVAPERLMQVYPGAPRDSGAYKRGGYEDDFSLVRSLWARLRI